MTEPQLLPAQPAPPSNARLLVPVGLLVAGLVGLIGAVLPWVSISMSAGGVSQSIDTSSLSGPGGGPWRWAALLFGAIVLLIAAGYLFGRRNRGPLGAAAVFSLLLLCVGIYKIVDVYRQAEQTYQQMDELVARVPAAARAGFGSFRDVFHINPGTGLWMVAIGGLLGAVLALVLILTAPKPEAAEGWLQPIPNPPPPARPATPASEEGIPPTA